MEKKKQFAESLKKSFKKLNDLLHYGKPSGVKEKNKGNHVVDPINIGIKDYSSMKVELKNCQPHKWMNYKTTGHNGSTLMVQCIKCKVGVILTKQPGLLWIGNCPKCKVECRAELFHGIIKR